MKVALVYDRVNKYGGAERFLETLLKIFPDAPLYTLVYSPKKANWIKNTKVIPTFLNYLSFLRDNHEILSPVAPLAFETHDLREYDLVVSVTSSDAKAVLTVPTQKHVCICLTPTRYLWKGAKNYKQDWKMRLLPKFLVNYFRLVDEVISLRPDDYIAISKEVKKRIKRYYHRKSTVIYPPVSNLFFQKHKKHTKKDFYLVAGRLVPYKKVDIVIECFNKLNKELVIVGGGSELNRLKKMANPNIKFLGEVSDKDLIKYYSQAKALIFPGLEDFGLIPLEAQSQGTPVIAYGRGGARETVVNGKTGIFFGQQSPKSLELAIEKFERTTIKTIDCITNAKKFSEEKFKNNLLKYLQSLFSQ